MTSRFHEPLASPSTEKYARLVEEALQAFSTDVGYAIQIVESARSISTKKRSTKKRN